MINYIDIYTVCVCVCVCVCVAYCILLSAYIISHKISAYPNKIIEFTQIILLFII